MLRDLTFQERHVSYSEEPIMFHRHSLKCTFPGAVTNTLWSSSPQTAMWGWSS